MRGRHIQIAELSDNLLEVREADNKTVFLLERAKFRCPNLNCSSEKVFRVKQITYKNQKMGGPSTNVYCFECARVFEISNVEVDDSAFWKKIIEVRDDIVSSGYGQTNPINDLEI